MKAMTILLICLVFACMGMSDCANWFDYEDCEDHELEVRDPESDAVIGCIENPNK